MPPTSNNNPGSNMDVQRPASVPNQANQTFAQQPNVPAGPEPLSPELMAKTPGISNNSKKSSHILAIVIAVVIAILIIGAAVALFAFTKEDPQPQSAPSPTQPVVDDGVVTPETVDQVVQKIDQNLNSVNDQEDFTPNDISDQTLGLDEN